jgi:hypothetical protein
MCFRSHSASPPSEQRPAATASIVETTSTSGAAAQRDPRPDSDPEGGDSARPDPPAQQQAAGLGEQPESPRRQSCFSVCRQVHLQNSMALGAEEASHEEERLGASEILPHRAVSGVDLLGADPEEGRYLGVHGPVPGE